MELLDLPWELVNHVLHCYVQVAGVTEAWKARAVCRTFDQMVKQNVLAKQPVRAFLRLNGKGGRSILRTQMGPYLEYRVKKLNGARDFLPNFIKRMVEEVSQASGFAATEDWAKMLARLIPIKCSLAYHLITIDPSSKTSREKQSLFSQDIAENRVAAAAAIGNLPALAAFVVIRNEPLWKCSAAFGYPLEAAAFTDQLQTVAAIVDHWKRVDRGNANNQQMDAFQAAITAALDLNHQHVAVLLITEYDQVFPVLEGKTFDKWLTKAIENKQEAPLQAVLQLKFHSREDLLYKGFKHVCYLGLDHLVPVFFDRGLLHINQAFISRDCPLSVAAAAGNLLVVNKLLMLKANPDGATYPTPNYWGRSPLLEAAYKGHIPVMRTLLAWGATPSISNASMGFMRSYCLDSHVYNQVEQLLKVAQQMRVAIGLSEKASIMLPQTSTLQVVARAL